MNQRLQNLHDAGVSIWLDDLSRQRIDGGELAALIEEYSVTGVTTNPTIFAAAFQDMSVYGDELAKLKQDGGDVEEVIAALMSRDVKDACQVFQPVFEQSNGYDGRVSIEVAPTLANDADATVTQAAQLAERVGEDNVLVKIPATKEGLAAIRKTIAAGISVNVTLIFSLQRYREVIDAYLSGLADAAEQGRDLSLIHSVASFFVSRVDSEIDKRLEEIGSDEALALRGKAAIANAQLAYQTFQDAFNSERFAKLAEQGANIQRPLWASTGVKNPDYPDTLYVDQLIAPRCVNTMPEKTLLAFGERGTVADSGDSITANYANAGNVIAQLAQLGVDLDDVFNKLETEGVEKFIKSWDELVGSVQTALDKA